MVVWETYTFLKGRQENKWCSIWLFKPDKQSGINGVYFGNK